ncbi:hypothetical protein [Silvimonas sp.]|uniref:hypothetical protein n=1 Tax=Silvimonas sp. TaxID=2650811 RepID=UPI0028438CA1|nr:hypothetical protein [Silvimonas sp.]MDR3428358.1 hypothetical protein [Silvimonas sp.]
MHKPARLSGLVLLAGLMAGCASTPVEKPVNGDSFHSNELAQSGPNRAANLAMRDNLDSLALLLQKLYKRNPAEWKKTGAPDLQTAQGNVIDAIRNGTPLPGLPVNVRSVAALPLAFDPAFTGDRAGTLIYGLGTMLVEVYGGHLQLYLINGLDAQQLANAAHNIEVAAWMLANRKDAQGRVLLLSNEIGPDVRNLSFEREFGRMLSRLELLAEMNNEKYRRSAIDYAQSMIAGPFLQFIPVSAVTAAIPR